MIGQRLGPYELVELLGKGGMATVYRAYHPQMERFVAVKIIHAALAQDDEGMERFKQEARLIARLEHPHLLPVYDYDPEHDPPYIVMRYLEGGTLKEVIEAKQTLPLSEIAYLMRQITSALDYAHRNNIIHRDIKPSNIMIDADGNAYLTDFGIARIVGEVGMTQTGFAVGTPGYMSPEQGMGVANIDGRTDVYALGVMAYEMATGEAPYKGETPMAVLMQHFQAPIPFASLSNPDLPEDFDDIVQKALAKDPDERYETPGEFAAALSNLVDSSEIAATPQNLKTVAINAIKQIQEDRDTQALEQIMNEFKGTRSTGMRAIGQQGDSTKLVDVSDPKQAVPPGPKQGLIGGGVVVVLIIIVVAFFFINNQTQNANATASAEAQALIVANNKTAEAGTEVAAQADAGTETQIAERNANASATGRAKPTETATERVSPTPSATPNFAGLQALQELSVRAGPSSAYREIRTINMGTELEIVGKNGRWYQVLLPTGTTGWVLNSPLFVDSFGPLADVPDVEAATITPTATNTPNQTATQAVIERITQNARSTQNAEATNEQATANVQATATGLFNATATSKAQATNDAVATENTIETQNAVETANAQATNEQADANAIATENGLATVNAQASEIALATANAIATNEQATANAIATQNAIETANAQATNAQATANAQATMDAMATQNAMATANAVATNNVMATQLMQATQIMMATQASLPGRIPYFQDFSDGQSVLADSVFDASAWSVGPGAGENAVLVGRARISQAFTLLGNPATGGSPEWVEAGLTDYVMNFRINMDASEGARVVLRYTPGQPYYAIDIAQGRINIRRGDAGLDPEKDREAEKFVGSARGYTSPMKLNEWYEITIWMQGRNIYLFVDNSLVADAIDDLSPLPRAGDILFQTLNRTKDIYFDDVTVRRSNEASDHFQSSRFSSVWNTSTQNGEISLEHDANDDNQYVRMWRDGEFTAKINIADLDLRTRLYEEQGGFTLYLRESEAGALRLTEDAGNLDIALLDADKNVQQLGTIRNFYNYNLWEDLRIRYVAGQLQIWIGGDEEFSDSIVNLPPGQIRFVTERQDILRIDDLLLLEPVQR